MERINFANVSSIKDINSLAKDTFISHLGIKLTNITQKSSEARLKITKKIMAPNGFIHGGSITSLADTACGFGSMYHLKEGEVFAPIELKTNFISSVKKGTLICKAKLVHKGNSIHVWDANVYEEKTSKKIALFRCTQMIITQR
jgi:uncharacterized protein (TIGR00369 family)